MLNNLLKEKKLIKTRNENNSGGVLYSDSQNENFTHNLKQSTNSNSINKKIETPNSQINNNLDNLDNETNFKIDISNPSEELINYINSDLDAIDSENMLENLVKILQSIQEEVTKKFENSKYLQKIQEIFEKNFEIIINYFIRCLQHTDSVKNSVKENLGNGLSQLNQIIQSEVDDVMKSFNNNFNNNLNNNLNSKNSQNLYNSNSGLIFDEELVALINSISSSIKEFMKNTKSCVKLISQNLETQVDQIVISKSNLNDILIYSSSSNNNIKKFSSTDQISQFKLTKEKVNNILEKLENLNQLRHNMSLNIKHVDNYCGKFYDEAKVIFKKLKVLHNEKLNEIQKLNEEYNNLNLNNVETRINNRNNIPANKQNLTNSRSTDNFNTRKNMRKVDSISPIPKKNNYGTNSNINKNLQNSHLLNSSNSFVNYSTNLESSNSQSKIMKYNMAAKLTKINKNSVNKSLNKSLNKSTDNFSTKNNRYSHITSTNPNNSTNPLNTSSGNNNYNILTTSQNFNSNLNQSELKNQLDELKIRNQELLEEISKLHETYLSSQCENLNFKNENEILRNNFNNNFNNYNDEYIEERELKITPKPIENSSIKKSKSVDKFIKTKTNSSQNVSGLTQSVNISHKFETLFKLSEMVILFIRQMSNLQDAISKKANNVKELKKDFEVKKKELISFANEIIIRNKNKENLSSKENAIEISETPKIIKNISITHTHSHVNKLEIIHCDIFNILNTRNSYDYINKTLHYSLIEELNIKFLQEKENLNQINLNLEEEIEKLNLDFNSIFKKLDEENRKISIEKENLNLINFNLEEEIKKLNSTQNSIFKKYEEENKILLKEINSIKNTNEVLTKENKKIIYENSENKSKIKNLNNEIKSLNEKIKKIEDEIIYKNSLIENKNNFNLEENKKLQQEIEKDKNQLKQNSEEIKNKNNQIQMLNNQLEILNQLNEDTNKKINNLNNQIEIINEEMNKKNNQLTKLENKNSFLLEDKNKQISIYSDKVDELKNQIKILQEEISENKIIIKEHLQIIDENKKSREKEKQILKEKEDEYKKEIQKLNEENKNINEEFRKLYQDISLRENELLEMQEKSKKIMTYKSESSNIEIDTIKSKFNDTEKINENLKKEILNIKYSLKNLHQEVTNKYKQVNNNYSNKKIVNNNNKNKLFTRKNVDEAFLFDSEFLEIKEEDEDLNMYNSNFSNFDNLTPNELAKEILQILETLIQRMNKLNEEKSMIIKELSNLKSSNISNNNSKNDYKLLEQTEENKRLKNLFEECTLTIYETIKSTAPNMFEEMNFEMDSRNSDKSPNLSEGDFIQKAVEMFKKYNSEINEENKKIKKESEENEQNLRKFKIMADEYKSALDLAISRNDVNDKNNYANNIMNTNPNSSLTINKENMNNFTVDDLIEMSVDVEKLKDNKKVNHNYNIDSINNLNNLNNNNDLEKNILYDEFMKKILEKEKEIKDLINIQDDLVNKLAIKDEELSHYKNACSKLLSINNNSDNKQMIPIEKYQIILEQFNEEQEKFNEMNTQYEVLKRDFEVLKSRNLVNNKDYKDNLNQRKLIIPVLNLKSITNINNQDEITNLNKKEINNINNDEDEINDNEDGDGDEDEDITDEDFDEEAYIEKLNKSAYDKISNTDIKNNVNKSTNVLKIHNKSMGQINQQNNLNYLAMLNKNKNNNNINDSYIKTQNSVSENNNTYIQDAIQDAIVKFEEHEELLTEQLSAIKKELKETREEREIYKRKFEESITLSDGKKNEVLTLLQQAFEKLIIEITITPKIRELIAVILRVLDYSEEHIIMIFNAKEKNKKTFFNFFGK